MRVSDGAALRLRIRPKGCRAMAMVSADLVAGPTKALAGPGREERIAPVDRLADGLAGFREQDEAGDEEEGSATDDRQDQDDEADQNEERANSQKDDPLDQRRLRRMLGKEVGEEVLRRGWREEILGVINRKVWTAIARTCRRCRCWLRWRRQPRRFPEGSDRCGGLSIRGAVRRSHEGELADPSLVRHASSECRLPMFSATARFGSNLEYRRLAGGHETPSVPTLGERGIESHAGP